MCATRVTTSRGFVVAYRAPVIKGALGKEEQRPIHAKDVEQLVRTEWRLQVPYIVINNVLTVVSHVSTDLQEATGVHEEGIDHPRIGSAGPENTVPVGRPADGGSRVPAVEHTRGNASEHTISGVTASGRPLGRRRLLLRARRPSHLRGLQTLEVVWTRRRLGG
jgi:hypothetical protein